MAEIKHYDVCHFLNYNTYYDLNLYEVGTQKCPKSYSFGPIVREHYILHYVYRGCGILRLDKQTYPIHEKEVFVLPPNVTTFYQADKNNPWSYIWLHFDGAKVVELLWKAGISRTNPVICPLYSGAEIVRCMEKILHNSSNELLCIGMLYHFFEKLIANSPKKVEDEEMDTRLKYVKAVTDYIALKYYEPIQIQDITILCGLERSYLTRIFKESTGHSPQEYLLGYRIKRAKNLLKNLDLSIQYIANSVGYENPLTFSKTFKKHTGMSPTQYRSLSAQGLEIPVVNGP